MNAPIFKFQDNSDFDLFVEFYSCFYNYKKEPLYDKHINANSFCETALYELFDFKTGPHFSASKIKKSFEDKILSKQDIINDFKAFLNFINYEFVVMEKVEETPTMEEEKPLVSERMMKTLLKQAENVVSDNDSLYL